MLWTTGEKWPRPLQWNLLLQVNEPSGCQDKKLLERWLREDYLIRDQLEWEITGQISRRYVANLQADSFWAIQICIYCPRKSTRKRKVIGYRRTHAKKWRNAVKHGINTGTVVFNPCSSNYEAYKSVRNKVTSLLRADEDAHRKRLLKDFKGNPRRFYRHMKNLQTDKDNVTALKTRVAIHYRLSHVRHDWCRMTYCVPAIRLIHEECPKSDRSYARSHVRNITVAR